MSEKNSSIDGRSEAKMPENTRRSLRLPRKRAPKMRAGRFANTIVIRKRITLLLQLVRRNSEKIKASLGQI